KDIAIRESKLANLQAVPKPTLEQQIALRNEEREIKWDYAEVGYVRQDSNVTAPTPTSTSTPSLAKDDIIGENEALFRSAAIDPDRMTQLSAIVDQIMTNKDRYQKSTGDSGVPWYAIAILHAEDSGMNFDVNFVNGDPLTGRTVHIPAGR